MGAACRAADPALFFPEGRETETMKEAREEAAVAVCATCPVIEQCRSHGMDEVWGVWGGLTEADRARMRRARLKPPAPTVAPVVKEERGCKYDGCQSRHFGHGWCKKHWSRIKAHGSPEKPVPSQRPQLCCVVEGCEGKHHSSGYCNKHLLRVRRTGNALHEGETIPDPTTLHAERYDLAAIEKEAS